MRRSAISRRTNRVEVPSRSAACSTVNSESNLGSSQPADPASCSGRGGQLLPGDAAALPGPGGSCQGQPRLALGLIAAATNAQLATVSMSSSSSGPVPGVQRHAIAVPAAGVLHTGAAQDGEGGGVAAALGLPVAPEAEHVRPPPQPQPVEPWPAAQLPAGTHQRG